jgi:trehalose-6-phosphate synthase
MSPAERLRRMNSMREVVRKQDIFWWVDCYLKAALGAVPEDFRTPKDYLPAPAESDKTWLEI